MADNPEPEMTRAERIFVRISVLQTILAVAGMFTGCVALWAALNESDAVRKQQMASVWPHVTVRDFNFGLEGADRYQVVVGNRGIGPARIATAEIFLDGERVDAWTDLVRPLTDEEAVNISTVRISSSVLAPGEDIVVFGVDASYAPKNLVQAVQGLSRSGRINLVICYCSVFDDCWRLDALAERTSSVGQCPIPARRSSI